MSTYCKVSPTYYFPKEKDKTSRNLLYYYRFDPNLFSRISFWCESFVEQLDLSGSFTTTPIDGYCFYQTINTISTPILEIISSGILNCEYDSTSYEKLITSYTPITSITTIDDHCEYLQPTIPTPYNPTGYSPGLFQENISGYCNSTTINTVNQGIYITPVSISGFCPSNTIINTINPTLPIVSVTLNCEINEEKYMPSEILEISPGLIINYIDINCEINANSF